MRVVVIGAGIVGATIAYELAQVSELEKVSELEITVLDRLAQPQTADQTHYDTGTGGALGLLMASISKKAKGRSWQMRELAMDWYDRMIPAVEQATGLVIPVNRQGILMLQDFATDLTPWEKLLALRCEQQRPLEIWTAAKIQLMLPQLAVAGTGAAIYAPTDRQVHPARLTAALIVAAQQQGVEFRWQMMVTGMRIEAGRVRQVQTEAGPIDCDCVVIAAGLGVAALSQELASQELASQEFVSQELASQELASQEFVSQELASQELASQELAQPMTSGRSETIALRPVLGQAMQIALPQQLGLPEFQPVVTSQDVHLVPLGRQPDGAWHYWVGATVEFPDAAGQALPPDRELWAALWQTAVGYCPAIAQAQILRQWSGLRPRPQGRPAPIVERLPAFENVVVAAGHYRNGVLLAPATAIAVRELIRELIAAIG
jgi:glycine/D-amino acid oxidase-like deaminating enzyme